MVLSLCIPYDVMYESETIDVYCLSGLRGVMKIATMLCGCSGLGRDYGSYCKYRSSIVSSYHIDGS
jgi:hypothetical protein